MTYIIEILGIVAGLFYIIYGLGKYGWWEGISISGGFMPVVCGSFVVVCATLMLIDKIRKKEKAEKFNVRALIPVGAMLLILVCNYFIGMLGACVLVMFLWLRFFEKYSWLKSAVISAVIFVGVFAIFRLWLNVPFPKGIIGQLM